METLRLMIIDDEKRIRTSLKKVLELHCPDTEVVAEADAVATALETIKAAKPDVLLLDIKMPDGSGFDLLRQLPASGCKVIFITAFDQHALQAFKFSAVDYLLKPIIPDELISALSRAREQLRKPDSGLEVLMSNLNSITRESKKVVLNSHDKMQVVGLNEIIRCEADRNYTLFILKDKKPILVSHSLKEYDEMLSPFGFFRTHHSHLVNLYFVDRLEKTDGGRLVMKDGSEALISSRKYSDFIAALNRI
jgi:two-component system LytT family response regulator